jgi:DNA-binding transcriptional regulator GbsR (MarR family)
MTRQIPQEMTDLCNLVGDFIYYWGFRKTDGQIWAHIFLSADPISASDLATRLQISKASVSLSVNELLSYEVIVESSKGPRGKIYYRSVSDLGEVIRRVLRKRENSMLNNMQESAATLNRSMSRPEVAQAVDGHQLGLLAAMIGMAKMGLDHLTLGPSILGQLNTELMGAALEQAKRADAHQRS